MKTDNTNKELVEENKNLRQQIQDLERSNIIFKSFLDNAPALISAKDLQGNVILTNKFFAVLEGPSPEEFIGKNVYDLFPFEIADKLWKNDLQAIQQNKPINAEESVTHKDGSEHIYYTVKFPLYDKAEKTFGTCAFSVDITQSKLAEKQSIMDELTGLYNRRYFNTRFESELKLAKRNGLILVFMMIDIDHFKDFNDHYGHQKGDEVLSAVGHKLRSSMRRPGDLMFRMGGEEFGCILSIQQLSKAQQTAELIRQSIESMNILHEFNPPHQRVTVSIGIKTIQPDDLITTTKLYKQADDALYQAKRDGRNNVFVSK